MDPGGRFTRSLPWLLLMGLLPAVSGAAPRIPDLDCAIEPYVVADVGSPVPGVLERIDVDRSDVVKKGQVLARLESGVEEAAVNVARARATMDSQIKAMEASLAFGKRKQSRTAELYQKKAIPFHTMDEAETEAVLADVKLREAKEEKRLAELELAQAREVLERRTIRSPVDGVVVERLMHEGEFVDDKPVLTIAQIHPLRVEAIAPVELFGRVSVGMDAEVLPEYPEGARYRAQVSRVDRVVEGASGTFGVRLELPNPELALPSGLKCRVRISGASPAKMAATRPRAAEGREGPVAAESAELGEDPRPAAPARRPAAATQACKTVGPLDRAETARVLEAALKAEGIPVTRRQEAVTVTSSYMVVIPGAGTVKESAGRMAELKAKGVDDLWLIPKGELRGSISAGLYSSEAAAARRQQALEAKGVESALRPNRRQRKAVWLDLRVPEDEDTVRGLAAAVGGVAPGLSLQDCPRLAAAP